MGVLGGTFNPPHNGHVTSARYAYRQLDLGRVLLMPVRIPPHKTAEEDPGPEHRLEMCRLAAGGDHRLLVSSLEVQREGTSYTVDTLRAIHASDPGTRLTFIVGADMARTLPQWREPEEILRLARLAVAERDGAAREEIVAALEGVGAAERVSFLDMPPVDVSSSMVRERVAHGLAIDSLVPPAVAEYIQRHGLYREPHSEPGDAQRAAQSGDRAGSRDDERHQAPSEVLGA